MGRLSPRLLAWIAVAAATAATPAFAADMEAAPVYKTPVYYQPAHYDWTGIYLGGLVGGGLLQDTVTATASTLEPAGAQTRYSPFAVVGGGDIGVNLEMAPWVVGFEGDWLSSAISGSQITTSLVGGTTARATSAPHWYGMATGRVGYAADDLLFYAKAGGAFMRVDYTEDVLTGGAVSSSQIIADTRTGFTVGGGFEYAMNEALSVKLEYDFLDFGSKNYTFNLTTPAGAAVTAPFSIKSDTQLFLLGFNYRFNWVQRSPVAAKY